LEKKSLTESYEDGNFDDENESEFPIQEEVFKILTENFGLEREEADLLVTHYSDMIDEMHDVNFTLEEIAEELLKKLDQ